MEKANKIQPIAAKECIMVGDRPDEDAHAKKLGFFTILFNPRKNAEKEVTPNLTVTNHDELLRFFTTIF